MKILFAIASIFLLIEIGLSQSAEKAFEAHNNIVGSIWKADGNWMDGKPFKLDIQFEWGLSGKIIKTRTYGNIKTDGYEFGLRNEGIQAWSNEDQRMEFWEFDVFGGITTGIISYKERNIYFHYSYETGEGVMELTDSWVYIDEDTYEFSVGVYNQEKNAWENKFLSTQMKRSK